MRRVKIRFIISTLFLILGILIYFAFHFHYMERSNSTYTFIRNYVPDMCWVFSFFFVSVNFANKISNRPLLLNSVYVFAIATFFEFLQMFNIIKGTFDIVDIILYSISIVSAYFIEKKLRRTEYEKSI